MKCRTGFVSNSSSSSFVVVFPKKPKTFNELKKYMYPKESIDDIAIDDWYGDDDRMTIKDIINRVLKDTLPQKRSNKKQLIEEFDSLWGANDFRRYGASEELVGEWEELERIADSRFEFENHPLYRDKRYSDNLSFRLTINEFKKIKLILKDKKMALLHIHDESDSVRFIAEEVIKNPDRPANKVIIEYCKSIRERYSESEKYSRKRRMVTNKIADQCAQKFKKENKGKWIGIYIYADESGEGELEHGEIFRNLKHIRFSHH